MQKSTDIGAFFCRVGEDNISIEGDTLIQQARIGDNDCKFKNKKTGTKYFVPVFFDAICYLLFVFHFFIYCFIFRTHFKVIVCITQCHGERIFIRS